MKYRSRIGIIWFIGVFILFLCSGYYGQLMLHHIQPVTVIGGLFFLSMDLLFLYMTFDTWYQFHEDALEIHCACFVHKRISYHDMLQMKQVTNMYSSIAMSMQRIQITFQAQQDGNGEDEVFISPVAKEAFLQTLQAYRDRVL